MTKTTNKQEFIIEAKNETLVIFAYTTTTRYCTREFAECNGKRAQYKYSNRPWQRFDYDIALEKLGKALGVEANTAIQEWAERKLEEERAASERFLERFKAAHSQLNERQKKSLENVEVQTQEEANTLMTIVEVGVLLNQF